MKVLIDLQGAQSPSYARRGIGRYSIGITRAIISQAARHDICILLSDHFPEEADYLKKTFLPLIGHDRIYSWRGPDDYVGRKQSSETAVAAAAASMEALLRSVDPDVLLVTSLFTGFTDPAFSWFEAKATPFLRCVILYDLIPYIYQSDYLADKATAHWYMARVAELKRADAMLAISESSRRDAITHLGIDPGLVVNVSSDADRRFSPQPCRTADAQNLLTGLGIRGDYILYTAGMDQRKNMEGLIRAYAMLAPAARCKFQLVIVCEATKAQKDFFFDLAASAQMCGSELILTGFVKEEDLVVLYNLASLFVFPSFYEGFGLPVLEAMRCGVPTIGARNSSLVEILGDECAMFDPSDAADFAEKLHAGMFDQDLRRVLKENASIQSSRFSWTDTARKALAFLEEKSRVNPSKAESCSLAGWLPSYVSASSKSGHELSVHHTWVDAQVQFWLGGTFEAALLNDWKLTRQLLDQSQFGSQVKAHLQIQDTSTEAVARKYNNFGSYRFEENAKTLADWADHTSRRNMSRDIIIPILMVDIIGPNIPVIGYNRSRVHNNVRATLWPMSYHVDIARNGLRDDQDFDDKSDRLVFRGALSGPGKPILSDRYIKHTRLEIIVNILASFPEASVGITDVPDESAEMIAEPRMAEFADRLLAPKMPFAKMLESRYVLCIEGADISSGFGGVLASHAVPVHPYPFNFEVWYFNGLQPWQHFVPIAGDGSNIAEVMTFCRSRQDLMRRISQSGRMHMKKMLDQDRIKAIKRGVTTLWNLPRRPPY